jgi:hypothetical protein
MASKILQSLWGSLTSGVGSQGRKGQEASASDGSTTASRDGSEFDIASVTSDISAAVGSAPRPEVIDRFRCPTKGVWSAVSTQNARCFRITQAETEKGEPFAEVRLLLELKHDRYLDLRQRVDPDILFSMITYAVVPKQKSGALLCIMPAQGFHMDCAKKITEAIDKLTAQIIEHMPNDEYLALCTEHLPY